jgi:hypothetical protein
MSIPTYFRDAADYRDWWSFSGTALGAQSPGETFKLLHEQLSEAGANTVIAARFLEENEQGIDPQLWRGAFVYGHVGLQVSLTLRALDAIGAVGTAHALRSLPGQPSLISRAEDIVRSGNVDVGKAAELIEELRERMAARRAHVLGDAAHGAAPPPRPAEGVETRDDFLRLLDAYVAAHEQDLTRDVARYGDPRRAPDFDPEIARQDRARRIDRLNYQRYQRNVLDDLREHLDKLKALAANELPESPRLNKALRQVMEERDEFARRPPGDLIPEAEAWLREVDRFREAHPDVFAPKASRDARVNARLAEIGPYEVWFDSEAPTITWDAPSGLDRDWTRFRLTFHVVPKKRPETSRIDAALDALCDEFGRLRERWPRLLTELGSYVFDDFRDRVWDQLAADEREAYRDDGGPSEAKVLRAVKRGTIVLTCGQRAKVQANVYFRVPWDEEHGLEVEFNADGEVVRHF